MSDGDGWDDGVEPSEEGVRDSVRKDGVTEECVVKETDPVRGTHGTRGNRTL